MLREANVIRSVAFRLFAHVSTASLLMQVELLSEIRHGVKLKIFFSNQCKKKKINDILKWRALEATTTWLVLPVKIYMM